jgi:hypothetical protein
MNKIKVYSFYVARLLDFLVIALPVYIVCKWTFIQTPFLQYCLSLRFDWLPADKISDLLHSELVATWTPFTKLLACISQFIAIVPFLGILYCLAKVFHRYEMGEIFTLVNAQRYYQIGKLLFIDALLAQPISQGLSVMAATFSNPTGLRYIRISIGTPNFLAVLLGLLVIFISWVMIEGSKIQEEQQLIV